MLHQNDTTPKTTVDETKLPENLGQYRVTRLIGRGGMGAVYKAICETTHDTVAIKTIRVQRGSSVSQEQVRRFRQEAEFLSRTQHPNIVHFVDFGIEEDQLFLVMEHVEGQTLKSYLQKYGQLSLKAFLDIAIQMADVVHSLQSNGLVHRDLKPQNVMLTPTLGMDLVKVLDFGISSLAPELGSKGSREGVVMGTASYASPEQSGLTDTPIDSRSDLYSLGVLFFEMLAGTPPFVGDPESITYQHLSAAPPSLKSLRKELPDALSDIVGKLLQKTPAERYQTGYGLLADLKECRRQIAAGGNDWKIAIASYDHFRGLNFTSKLIGRDRHLQTLQKSVDLAKSGTTHIVQVAGELGIGKSFLLSDFHLRAIQKQCAFLSCRLQRMAFDCGLQPLAQTLDNYFMQILRSSESRRRKVLEQLADVVTAHAVSLLRNIHSAREIISQIMDIIPETLEVVSYNIETRPRDLSEMKSQHALKETLLVLFQEIAKIEECAVLEVDSLHWADEAIFEFLEELAIAASKQSCRLLCVLTASYENPTGVEGCQHLIHRLRQQQVYVHQILLEPFSLDDVRDFVSEIVTESPEQIDALANSLHAFTKGNPLFLREALKSMVVYGNLAFDNTSRNWRYVKQDLSKLQLPADVVDLIIERTKPFSPETKLILSTAARLGASFGRSALDAVLPEMNDSIQTATAQALSEHLLIERDGKFGFAHSKIREFFLLRLDRAEAAELHYRILKTLNANNFDDETSALREYAHHAYFSDQKVDSEVACAACALLGLAEEKQGEFQRAQEQMQRALEIAKGSRSSRLHDSVMAIEIQLADILRRQGQSRRAETLLEEVLQKVGGRLTSFPQDLLFSAIEKIQIIKLMRGEHFTFEYAGQNLTEISLSILRSELDLLPLSNNTEAVVDIAIKLFGEPTNAESKRVEEKRESADFAATLKEPLPDMESFFKNLVKHPHGLTPLFIKEGQRAKSAVQFLLATHLNTESQDNTEVLDRLWKTRKDLFLEIHPDLLWTVWLEEFSAKNSRTEMQLMLEEILQSIAVSKMHSSLIARMFSLCIRAIVEWRELDLDVLATVRNDLRLALEECRNAGIHYSSIWGLLVQSNFMFLQGEWDELIKVIEEAIAEAEHLDFPVMATECLAYHAALGTLRDQSKLDRTESHINESALRPRASALLQLAAFLDDFAENPIEANLDLQERLAKYSDSLWHRTNPLIVFGNFLSISTRIASICDGRCGSAFTSNAMLQNIESEVDTLFPEERQKGYCSLFRTLLIHGLECARGNYSEAESGFFRAESEATRYRVLSWLTFSRIQNYRIKIAEARRRESQSLADEASVHLVCADKMASDAGFIRLAERLANIANSLSNSEEMSAMTSEKSLSHGVTTIMGRLKIDRVFAYSAMLLTKQSIEELLPHALEAFIEITGAQRGGILLRDRVATSFSLKALQGVPHTDDVFQRIVIDSVSEPDYDLPISWSVVSKVRTEGRIIIVHNAQTDESIANQFSVVKNHIRSVLGMPLIHNDEVLGILYLDSCLLNDLFNRESVKLLHPVARQLAFSISNIWLKKSTEEAYFALKQSQKYLIQSEKMAGIGTMAASVAHDFRTPLSIIMGLTEDIKELVKDGDVPGIDDNANRILNAAQKLQRLVQSMQDFSRKSTREIGPVDLAKIMDEVIFLTEKKMKQAGVQLVLNMPKDLPMLSGNANELEQVLMNLINNAVDAMDKAETKRLRIESRLQSDESIEIQVSDSGSGIQDADRKSIFQPFFTTKPVGKGTGLGLSIVKTLIEGQHGTIRYETAPEHGTTFFIILPTVDKTGNVKGRQQTPQEPERARG